MLKKNPNCVETIKRLRRYVGNIKNWTISEDAKRLFILKTEKVRQRANEIYDSFKVCVRDVLLNQLNNQSGHQLLMFTSYFFPPGCLEYVSAVE